MYQCHNEDEMSSHGCQSCEESESVYVMITTNAVFGGYNHILCIISEMTLNEKSYSTQIFTRYLFVIFCILLLNYVCR